MSQFLVGKRVVLDPAYAGQLDGDPGTGLIVEVCGPRKVKVLWAGGRVTSHDPSGPYMLRFKVESR